MERVSRFVSKASRLGYALVAIPFPPRLDEAVVGKMRRECEDVGAELVTRVDLRPRTTEDLLSGLRRLRRRFEIVAVMCESKHVARQAAKDRRVDILNFPLLDFRRRFFDAAEAELASNSLVSLEIDMGPLLSLEGVARVKLLSNLRREVATAKDFRVPIVISSGVTDEMLMKKPAELVALASLFDLSGVSALDAVSNNPVMIVRRNQGKLDHRFIAPGIRVVRRGKDC
jgi:RNase P/RNase MRP subunit p30